LFSKIIFINNVASIAAGGFSFNVLIVIILMCRFVIHQECWGLEGRLCDHRILHHVVFAGELEAWIALLLFSHLFFWYLRYLWHRLTVHFGSCRRLPLGICSWLQCWEYRKLVCNASEDVFVVHSSTGASYRAAWAIMQVLINRLWLI